MAALRIVLLGGLIASAGAQPLLLLDTTFTHGATVETRPSAAFPLASRVPANWTAPDYATGTAYFRLEILEKPTGVAIRYQPCLERDATRACATSQLLSDSGATRAVYLWSQPLAQWIPTGMSWSTRPDRIVLVLQDAYGKPILPAGPANPDPVWVGQPFLSLYYPMRVRFSSALMPSGAAFPGWSGLIPTAINLSGSDGNARCSAREPQTQARMAFPGTVVPGASGYRDALGRRLPGMRMAAERDAVPQTRP